MKLYYPIVIVIVTLIKKTGIGGIMSFKYINIWLKGFYILIYKKDIMSNQFLHGSQPFINEDDDYYKDLTAEDLKYILKMKKIELRQNYKGLTERQKLIRDIKRVSKLNDKVLKGVDIKEKYKKKLQSPVVSTPPSKKIKTFEEYFEECIKNKEIPKDTPPYFREALERAMYEYDQGLEREKSSLEGFANKYIIQGIPGLSPEQYYERINKTLKDFFTYHRNIKFKMVLVCIMEKQEIQQNVGVVGLEEDKAYFYSFTLTNLKSTDVDELIRWSYDGIDGAIEAYQEKGSAWYFKEVDKLEIHTVKFNPLKGSTYLPLPDWIKNKQAIINMKNKDDKCFIWSILRQLYPKKKDPQYIGDLKVYENTLNTKGLIFPMPLDNISKFEKLNPLLPGINVFSYNEKDKIYPLRLAKRDCKCTIDLFFHTEGSISHYSLIKNFSRLIRRQIRDTSNFPLFICKRCFSYFSVENKLEKHIEYCSNNETAVVKMPEKDTYLYFKNYRKQLPIPFVVYADFECFTKPMNSCSPNPKDSYNYNYQKHEPSGFCFYIKGIVPGINFKPIIYTKTIEDEDISKVFVEKLKEVTKGIYNDFYRRPKPLRLTREEEKLFEKAVNCHICSRELREDKVRDHCHFTGKYRGAAHNKCNLLCRKPMVLPVIFHNLQGYDAHLFIKQLARLEGDLNCIPSTEEKYI